MVLTQAGLPWMVYPAYRSAIDVWCQVFTKEGPLHSMGSEYIAPRMFLVDYVTVNVM